jgi:hypothetical protein
VSESGGGKSWLKYGCFGCLGVVGFGVIVAAALFGLASIQVSGEKLEVRKLTHDATAEAPADPAGDAGRGHVRIRVANGGFELAPAEPGEPLRVDAEYDAASYRLDERLVEREDGWDYELEFDRTGSLVMSVLKQLLGGTSPTLTIYLPPDAPLDLDLEVYRGGGSIELGGLWLRSVRMHAKQGGVDFRVSDPLRLPVEEMTIEAAMGGMAVSELGNASPRKLDVDVNMGGLALDLDGEWLVDSQISIGASRGEVDMRLPDGVAIEGLGDLGRGLQSRNDELPGLTLRFQTSVHNSGEISVSGVPVDVD